MPAYLGGPVQPSASSSPQVPELLCPQGLGVVGGDEGADEPGVTGGDEGADEPGVTGEDEGADEPGVTGGEGAEEPGAVGIEGKEDGFGASPSNS
jgi:hypothetical protein